MTPSMNLGIIIIVLEFKTITIHLNGPRDRQKKEGMSPAEQTAL